MANSRSSTASDAIASWPKAGFAIAVAATKEFEAKHPKPAEREPGEHDEMIELETQSGRLRIHGHSPPLSEGGIPWHCRENNAAVLSHDEMRRPLHSENCEIRWTL